MRRPVFLIFVNAMILVVVFALLTQSLLVVQRLAQARLVQGRVEVQSGGKGLFRPLAANDFVRSGDMVRTDSDGTAEFTWAGGTRWKVMPNTLIKIKKATTNSHRAETSQMEMARGKVFVRIARDLTPASRFEIQTPTALASVRGTIFSVEVKGRQTEVRVWKGTLALSGAGGQKAVIEPGQAGIASELTVEKRPERPDVQSSDFASEPSIIRPELEARVQALPSGQALVSGTTEAGNEISVNGQSTRVLGNGAFRLKLSTPDDGKFAVVASDKHGATSGWQGSLPAGAPAPEPVS